MKSARLPCRLVALLGIGAVVLAAPALAQDCPELVGRVPGEILAVTVSGEYAYLGTRLGLIIADASAPSAPWAVGEVSLPGEGAYDVAVLGTHAYVANHDAGLRVIDISLPWAPFEVGFVDTPGWAHSVVVAGNYAYVGEGYSGEGEGLRVIDVSNPAAPVVVWSWTLETVMDVAVAGSYAYVLGSYTIDHLFHVFDISDPSSPVEVGVLPVGGNALAVEGSYAFVVGGVALAVIDVSTPSAPVYLGFVYVGNFGYAEGVALSGNYAFVVRSYHHYQFDLEYGLFSVVDVSVPSAPVLVAELWPLGEAAHQIAVSGTYPYVVGDGLRVMDVSTPSAPVEVGGFSSVLGPKNSLAASGGYAYLAWAHSYWSPMGGGYTPCLGVIDLISQSVVGSVCLARYGLSHTATSMAVEGGFLYVSFLSGLEVIDVSTPSAPGSVGFLDLGWADSGRDLAVSGGHVFLTEGECEGGTLWDLLRVIDVSSPSTDPSTPVEVGTIEVPCALGVAAEGGYAYVAAGESGLLVIDVRTPSAPVEVGSLDTLGYASDVAVDGAHAYVADGNAGLRVIDVSTPSAPVEVGFLDTLGDAEKIAVSHGYAYVADPFGSLRAIDVSAPEAPFEVGLYEVNNSAGLLGVAVSDSFVLLGFDDPGLYILRGCSILFTDGFESGDTSAWSSTVP